MKLQQELEERYMIDNKKTRTKRAPKIRNIMEDEEELRPGREVVQDSEIMPV
jgi:hypothetical protein